jgi:Fur family transcriptional regulator, ferric uptake regulator
MSESIYKEMLRHEGLKNTGHRNSILKTIEKSPQPLTADSIYLSLINAGELINLSSVYRILNTLAEKRLVIKSSVTGENKAVFELNIFEHRHHFVCTRCKQIISVDGCPLEDYEKVLRDKMGFAVQGHKLEIYGICKDCRKEY